MHSEGYDSCFVTVCVCVCVYRRFVCYQSSGAITRFCSKKRYILHFYRCFSVFDSWNFEKTFRSKDIYMASFTCRKLTAIATALLLRPMILILTAYALLVALSLRDTHARARAAYVNTTRVLIQCHGENGNMNQLFF